VALLTKTPRERRTWDTPGEVAERLDCSSTVVYQLLEDGILRDAQLRRGGSWRIARASVDELAERMERALGNGRAT
jgi:excisionase family DNA binding protein